MEVVTLPAKALCQNTVHKFSTGYFLRRKQRKALKKQRRHKKRKHSKTPQIEEYSSRVLICLDRASFGLPYRTDTPLADLKVPKVFCISRNPDVSIQFLRKIYGAARNLSVGNIRFDYTSCVELGVGAVTVMEIILTECHKWRKSVKCPIEYSGVLLSEIHLSQNIEVERLLKAGGIFKLLKIIDEQQNEQYGDIESLDLQIDGASSKVATLVIEHINHSLNRHNLMLTEWGNNYLGSLLGEIVDNCHQHGGPGAIWYTIGHYSYNDKSNSGKCWLAILDFGETIYEGLKNSTTKATRKKFDHYVRRSRIWFSPQESEETLYTLFSLQQRVSRFALRKEVVRGNGTVAFLEAFQQLLVENMGQDKSLLSITSGKCSILFDGTYSFGEIKYEGGYKNKIIAFNPDNDLKKSPDHQYVRSIENGFPGTLISIELHISNTHISRKDEQYEND